MQEAVETSEVDRAIAGQCAAGIDIVINKDFPQVMQGVQNCAFASAVDAEQKCDGGEVECLAIANPFEVFQPDFGEHRRGLSVACGLSLNGSGDGGADTLEADWFGGMLWFNG